MGGNKYLTNATLLTSKHELRSCLVPEPFERLGYSDLSFYARGQTKVEFLEGDVGDRQGADAVRDARPHHRPLLAHGRARGPAADDLLR